MSFEYTKMVESHFLLHPEDSDASRKVMDKLHAQAQKYARNADIEALIANWRAEMNPVQTAYVFSGRREILRWFINRIQRSDWLEEHFENRKDPVTKIPKFAKLEVDGETVVYKQSSEQSYRFEMDMDVDTARNCAELIRDMCECKLPRKKALSLIKDAVRANTTTSLLTKQEAFQLGHMLGFSVNEMQDFLKRCFQDGVDRDGVGVSGAFDVKSSSDLIEYFTFLFPEFDPDALREEWNARKPDAVEPLGEQTGSEGITYEIYSYLHEGKPDWEENDLTSWEENDLTSWEENDLTSWEENDLTSEKRKERFFSWLEDNSVFLDRPSLSGTELMRCLSRKAIQVLRFYDLIPQGRECDPAFPRKQMDAIAQMIGEIDGKSINLVNLPNQIEGDIAARAFAGWDDWKPVADVLWYFFGKLENNRLFIAEKSPGRKGASKKEQREKKEKPKNPKVSKRIDIASEYGDNRIAPFRQADSASLYSFPIPRTGDFPGLWIQDVVARKGPDFRGMTGKSRLAGILSGEILPQKNDVLFFLLFIASIIWMNEDRKDADLTDKEAIVEMAKYELSEFQSFAHGVLDPERYPSLGRYYLPHYTEYTMNTAIVFSVLSENYNNPMSCYLRLITSL